MLNQRAPGVYFEWTDPRILEPLRTDVAGFVGLAARGPLHEPVRLESRTQFRSLFGGPIAAGYLAYAVEGFFANGGTTCWVVRAADPDTARPVWAELVDGRGLAALRLEASSPGRWGRRIVVALTRQGRGRFSLRLRLHGGESEFWADLDMLPGEEGYAPEVLAASRLVRAVDLVETCDLVDAPDTPVPVSIGPTAELWQGGAEGLATLTPAHLSGDGAPLEAWWGLRALEKIDEVGVVAMPDIMPTTPLAPRTRTRVDCRRLDASSAAPEPEPLSPEEFAPPFTPLQVFLLQAALVAHCETLRDRVALLDPPAGLITPRDIRTWRRSFDTSWAASYVPWLRVPDPLGLLGLLRDVPPSGHVAGIFARSDLESGVQKPPANAVVEGARDLDVDFDAEVHAVLHRDGVNLIRTLPGRGIRLLGARTLSSDTTLSQVHVRRLLILIAESLEEGLQWAVHEPSGPALWESVEREVESFLDALWRRGRLDGATREEAYFVRCDAETNPPEEIDAGRLVCLVGVLPPGAVELVLVRIGRDEAGLEILDVREEVRRA